MDAFGASHRQHASTYTVAKYAPKTCGGLLLMNEIKNIEKIFTNTKKTCFSNNWRIKRFQQN